MAIIGYYRGEAVPGRLIDSSGNGNTLVQVLDPGNPTTPAPVPDGARWLGGGESNFTLAAQYEIPPAAFTLATFLAGYTVEFWYHGKSGTVDNALTAFNPWYVDDLLHYERSRFFISGSDIVLNIEGSVGTELGNTVLGSVDTSKLIRIEFGAVGFASTVYVNNSVVATFTRLSDFTLPIASVWIMRSAPNWMYLDAFMLASGNGATYPGPQPGGITPAVLLLANRRRNWNN